MNIKGTLKNKYVRVTINFIFKRIFYLIYDEKYLQGDHFEKSYVGWIWAVRGLKNRFSFTNEGRKIKFPYSPYSTIYSEENLIFDISSLNSFQQKGCYFQNFSGKIYLGKNVWIAPNVGIITSNHDFDDLRKHTEPKNVVINDDCWIGMNSVILPGVILGENTIVAAGSVVTKSFEDGNCIVGGVPARVIKKTIRTELEYKK